MLGTPIAGEWLVEGGLPMSKTRPATPTVALIDQYCAQYLIRIQK
jgi:hypothetical protein